MKRVITDCDVCHAKNVQNSFPVEFVVGTQADSPSGRTETVTETFDLCLQCLGSLTQRLVDKLPREEQLRKATAYRERKPRS